MKKIILILLILSISLSLSATTMYLKFNGEYSYDTNVFSNPLPKNPSDSGFIENADYLKRHNFGFNFSFDTFFSQDSRTGLSISAAFRLPAHSDSYKAEGDINGDWEYVHRDSLSEQKLAMYLGIGPTFRAKIGIVDLGIALRGSIGSYDFFKSGIVVGVQAEPYMNLFLNDDSFIAFGFVYDAHLMKFVYDDTEKYQKNYMMLTAGAYFGIGIQIGDNR